MNLIMIHSHLIVNSPSNGYIGNCLSKKFIYGYEVEE